MFPRRIAHNRLSSERMILGACNSRVWSGVGAQVLCNVGRRHRDANVFRRLQQSLRETLSVAPTALTNGSRTRSVQTPDKKTP